MASIDWHVDRALGEALQALEEAWSDAARAASAAARKAKAKGGDWRMAGRTAFVKAGAPAADPAAVASGVLTRYVRPVRRALSDPERLVRRPLETMTAAARLVKARTSLESPDDRRIRRMMTGVGPQPAPRKPKARSAFALRA